MLLVLLLMLIYSCSSVNRGAPPQIFSAHPGSTKGLAIAGRRDMGKRRLPSDDLPEKMAAEKILAHLELASLELTRKPRPTRSGGNSTP